MHNAKWVEIIVTIVVINLLHRQTYSHDEGKDLYQKEHLQWREGLKSQGKMSA